MKSNIPSVAQPAWGKTNAKLPFSTLGDLHIQWGPPHRELLWGEPRCLPSEFLKDNELKAEIEACCNDRPQTPSSGKVLEAASASGKFQAPVLFWMRLAADSWLWGLSAVRGTLVSPFQRMWAWTSPSGPSSVHIKCAAPFSDPCNFLTLSVPFTEAFAFLL